MVFTKFNNGPRKLCEALFFDSLRPQFWWLAVKIRVTGSRRDEFRIGVYFRWRAT